MAVVVMRVPSVAVSMETATVAPYRDHFSFAVSLLFLSRFSFAFSLSLSEKSVSIFQVHFNLSFPVDQCFVDHIIHAIVLCFHVFSFLSLAFY